MDGDGIDWLVRDGGRQENGQDRIGAGHLARRIADRHGVISGVGGQHIGEGQSGASGTGHAVRAVEPPLIAGGRRPGSRHGKHGIAAQPHVDIGRLLRDRREHLHRQGHNGAGHAALGIRQNNRVFTALTGGNIGEGQHRACGIGEDGVGVEIPPVPQGCRS